MPDAAAGSYFLLSCFAEFYEAVADIKVAAREGRLPTLLADGSALAPSAPADLAARVSGRLARLLATQLNRVARDCPPATAQAHRIACYAMAALADEIFVLELDWSGRDAWLETLLETRLFKSHVAGRQVFATIEQLLELPVHDALHVDLAAVFLMVLQLGFQGRYRGTQGAATLRRQRERLYTLLRQHGASIGGTLAFPQAYRHIDASTTRTRLAPLTPWYVGGGIIVGIYLIVSSGVWFYLTQPFLDAMAGK